MQQFLHFITWRKEGKEKEDAQEKREWEVYEQPW